MKSKYIEMETEVTEKIVKYIDLQNQVNTNEVEDINQSSEQKEEIQKIFKEIKKGVYIIDFDDNKLLLGYFYNKKSNKLIFDNLYLYKRISSTESFFKRNFTSIIDVIFAVNTFLMIYCSQNKSFNNIMLLEIIYCVYIIIGIVLIVQLIYKNYNNERDNLKNYRVVKLGNNHVYNLDIYISKKEEIVYYIKLLYIALQLILVQVSLLLPVSALWSEFVIIIALITDIFCLKNLLNTLLQLYRVNGKFFSGLLIVTFVLGFIDQNTWAAVALSFTVVSLLISEDIWTLFQEDSPLSGRYNTKSNQNIIKKNILNLKIETNLCVLILCLIVFFLRDKHYSLNFFNGIFSLNNKICSSSIQAKFFDGFDKLFLVFILFLIYTWIDKRNQNDSQNPILCYAKELIRPLFSKIYKDIQKSDLEVIDEYGKLSDDIFNKYPELIIRDSTNIPEDTKLLLGKDNGNDVLKIVYPNKEVEIRKIKSIEKSKGQS